MYFSVDGSNLRLAGSMHMFPADLPVMPVWISGAYEWCEELVLEADDSEIGPHFRLSDGSILPDHLPFELWRTLCLLVPNEEQLRSLKPWAVLLSMPGLLMRLVPGVEGQLVGKAKADRKPITYLETCADLAQRLDTIPNDVFVECLAFTANNRERVHNGLCAMHAAWLRRDLAGVFAVASQALLWRSPVLREVVIASRNRAWISRIQSLTRSCRRTLVVFGALHLCGNANLIELCEQQGLKISRISSSD